MPVMHHGCLTRRFMTASIFSPLPKQSPAAIRAWLLISTATTVPQLSGFLHPTNCMQSHGGSQHQAQRPWGQLQGDTTMEISSSQLARGC